MTPHQELIEFLKQQSSVQKMRVPEHTMVSQPGDVCGNLVVVIDGQVKVYRPALNGRSLTLYNVNAGESCILTASCILNQTSFPVFAETTTEVNALVVPKHQVIEWLEHEPKWQKYMFGLLSQRMVNLIELLDTVAFESLDARLESWLLSHASENIIQVTHQQIAEDLGSSREVISRLLKKFERNGLLTLGRGTISLLNKLANN
jgi:CRP/FNR family transcriptional regulator